MSVCTELDVYQLLCLCPASYFIRQAIVKVSHVTNIRSDRKIAADK